MTLGPLPPYPRSPWPVPLPLPDPDILLKYGKLGAAVLRRLRGKARQLGTEHGQKWRETA